MESQLKTDIKNNMFKNVYILSGEEKHMVDYYCNAIVNANTDPDTKDFNYLKIVNTLPAEEDIDSFASSYPFMAEKKVLILQNTGIFKTTTEGMKKYFTSLCESMPEYLILIFCEIQINKKNELYKTISKIYPAVELNYKKPSELAPWISGYLRKNEKNIKSDIALYMCELAGPSMLNLKSEADKIISFLKDETEVTKELVDTLVTRTVENRVFDMMDSLINGNKSKAMKELADLKALGEEPIKIISIIFKKFSQLHMVYIMKGKPTAEIAAITSMRDWQIKTCTGQLKKMSIMTVAKVMSKCKDMDFAVKNGAIDKWLAIELIIAEILLT